MNRILLLSFLFFSCTQKETAVTRASNVILMDDALYGMNVTIDDVTNKLGPPCMVQEDSQTGEQLYAWSTIMNTVTRCMPTGMVLLVSFKDGRSKGYYIGEYP